MDNYLSAVEKFLIEFEKEHNVVGALVCGSYVTGNPSKHSDIDIHIILDSTLDYRERGNKIINGFLIEYFANPAKQIEEYFNNDWSKGKTMSLTQFSTGKIIKEQDHVVSNLVEKAKNLLNKPFSKQKDFKIELNKYALWDLLDNVEDAYEKQEVDFSFIYYHSLFKIYEIYAEFIGIPLQPFHKIYNVITSESTRKKYLLKEFSDKEFAQLLSSAIIEIERDKQLELMRKLVEIALRAMGGFEIDGWSMKSPLDIISN